MPKSKRVHPNTGRKLTEEDIANGVQGIPYSTWSSRKSAHTATGYELTSAMMPTAIASAPPYGCPIVLPMMLNGCPIVTAASIVPPIMMLIGAAAYGHNTPPMFPTTTAVNNVSNFSLFGSRPPAPDRDRQSEEDELNAPIPSST